jgi:hypothetical protein
VDGLENQAERQRKREPITTTFMGVSTMQDVDDDYQSQKAFLVFYDTTYRDMSFLPPELRPEYLRAKQEKEEPERAIANVRTEVNRIVFQSFRWSPSQIARFEAELSENGIVRLAALQDRFRKEYKAILKRGELRDLVEYYMAKELVSDTRPATGREREKLEEMMAVFEEAEVAKFKSGQQQ